MSIEHKIHLSFAWKGAPEYWIHDQNISKKISGLQLILNQAHSRVTVSFPDTLDVESVTDLSFTVQREHHPLSYPNIITLKKERIHNLAIQLLNRDSCEKKECCIGPPIPVIIPERLDNDESYTLLVERTPLNEIMAQIVPMLNVDTPITFEQRFFQTIGAVFSEANQNMNENERLGFPQSGRSAFFEGARRAMENLEHNDSSFFTTVIDSTNPDPEVQEDSPIDLEDQINELCQIQ